jgi:hypothetical protein
VALGAVCAMFTVLWFRALARVRVNVAERSMTASRVATTYCALTPIRAMWVLRRVVQLQGLVRRRRAAILKRRLVAMAA